MGKQTMRRRGSGYGAVAAVHDRRSTDLPASADVAAIEVDDPLALEHGDKIVVYRQLRNDPLARLHSHHQIDEAQYMAGRAYQRDWETAERGARAIDPTKEAVDGGRLPEPITESQRTAAIRLNKANAAIGQIGSAIVHDMLIVGLTVDGVARKHGKLGQYQLRLLNQKFRESLDELAKFYGLSGGARPQKTRG